MGDVNVLYCDGSVRSQIVKQGQEGLPTTNMKGPQALLDNSTQNGHIIAGMHATVPGTRFDPYLTP
jgi:prepilin-type processing-associated H-X9-DG protein